MMIPDRVPEKVTIEDLLRIKRAERPSPEFWTRFEQDLRAKQLAAIVEKRPWWHALHLPQAVRAVSRFQVPAGIAAILVFGFTVANHYQTVIPPSTHVTAPEVSAPIAQVAAVAPVAAEIKIPVAVAQVAAVSLSQAPQANPETRAAVADPVPAPMGMTVDATALSGQPTALTAMIPWGVGQEEENTVSTRLLDADLQVALISNLSVTSLLGNSRSEETPVQTSPAQAVEMKPAVAQASSPREMRRAKILAGLVLADNSDGADYARVMHGRDIAANDLSEAQLYDSVHRLGVGGDRFTLKF